MYYVSGIVHCSWSSCQHLGAETVKTTVPLWEQFDVSRGKFSGSGTLQIICYKTPPNFPIFLPIAWFRHIATLKFVGLSVLSSGLAIDCSHSTSLSRDSTYGNLLYAKKLRLTEDLSILRCSM